MPKRQRSHDTDDNEDAVIIHENNEKNEVNSNDKTYGNNNINNDNQLPSKLPIYLCNAFTDLYREDGLVALGKGMGYMELLALLCRFYADGKEGHSSLFHDIFGNEEDDGDVEKDNKREKMTKNKDESSTLTPKPTPIPPLVFLIGLDETERTNLLSILSSWDTSSSILPTIITTETTSGGASERSALYSRGGIFCVTARILVVDLLTGAASPSSGNDNNNINNNNNNDNTINSNGSTFGNNNNINNKTQRGGLIVAHAERATPDSTEAFIARIFRSLWRSTSSSLSSSSLQPPSGFVKAISERPDLLSSSGGGGGGDGNSRGRGSSSSGGGGSGGVAGRIDGILKSLRCAGGIFTYPRFLPDVEAEMSEYAPEVIELRQPLSCGMKIIQNSIIAIIRFCLREIKATTPMVDWSNPALSLQNCCTPSSGFDRNLSNRLDHTWYKLKHTTRGLVQDLRTLRNLIRYLTHYDCVGFYNLICNLRSISASAKNPSLWLLTPAAEMLFKAARERMYKVVVEGDENTAKDCNNNNNDSKCNGNNINSNKHNNISNKYSNNGNSYKNNKNIISNNIDNGSGNDKSITSTNNEISVSESVSKITIILEENPKWKVLKNILDEIEGGSNLNLNPNPIATTAPPVVVLVMVRDERTLESLQSYLVDGNGRRIMSLNWLRYLGRINERSRANTRTVDGRYGNISEEGRLLLEEEGRIRNYLFGNGRGKGGSDNCRPGGIPRFDTSNPILAWKKKRRKIDQERSRGTVTDGAVDDMESRAVLKEALEETERELYHGLSLDENNKGSAGMIESGDEKVRGIIQRQRQNKRKMKGSCIEKNYRSDASNHDSNDNHSISSSAYDSDIDADESAFRVEPIDDNVGMKVVIRTYSSIEGGGASLLLNETMPDVVVLYDIEPSFIRSLEMHCACCRSGFSKDDDRNKVKNLDDRGNRDQCGHHGHLLRRPRLKVYFLTFEDSAEESTFYGSVESERRAFERLISYKRSVPPPKDTIDLHTPQEMQIVGVTGASSYARETLPLSIDTRTGKGKNGGNNKGTRRRDVAVDVREFRSALPSVLHRGGMRIAPVTLTVGDYVLSDAHCIERKSISDLFGSFGSGRLHTQATSMCAHYSVPCLLIEFDPTRSFGLQNANDIVDRNIRLDDVCSRMSLLIMHFPKLRILWSRSPHETLKIFMTLKTNHSEVNVEKAMEIGSNASIDDGGDSVMMMSEGWVPGGGDDCSNSNENNAAAIQMLLKLPGVTPRSVRKITGACDSMRDLVMMSRDNLRLLMGPSIGQKLFTFFREKSSST